MEGLFKDTLISERLNRLKSLNQGQMFFNAVSDKRVQDFILFLVQYGQLFSRGINEFEEIIGRYSLLTEEINPEKVAGTPYTFKDTGQFFNSMFVTPNTESFIIDGDGVKVSKTRQGDSIIEKVTNLFELHGDSIIGLTEDSKEQLGRMLADKFIEDVRKIL
jgi:hypothetical protein